MKIRKAVLPVAGLGTRMLPATKAIPKEMITLVDKPLIQYGVEEAVNAGIEQIIFVTSQSKTALENHFDKNLELEISLEAGGKGELLKEVRRLSDMCEIVSVRQKEPKGLGHAIMCAKDIVGDEPFAVILPDDIIMGDNPAIGQLAAAYEETSSPIIALQKVPMEHASRYGIVNVEKELNDRLCKLSDMVEKPENPPSDMAIIGRYILTPEVLDAVASTGAGAGGEIQLTDGLRAVTRNSGSYGCLFEGTRFDCGNKMGLIEAVLGFALHRPDLKDDVTELITRLVRHRE